MDRSAVRGFDVPPGLIPFLTADDDNGLRKYLDSQCPRSTLTALLTGPELRLVKASVASLAARGTMAETPSLARLLHHPDAEASALAEDALWSIWLRAGNPEANGLVAEAIEEMNAGHYGRAVVRLDRAIRTSPGFAEAYNQRAIALYLAEKHLRSVADCRRTLALNPWHFGAAAGLGHCYAQLALYERAIDAYHAALKLHPRLDGVRLAVEHVREILHVRSRPRGSHD